MSAEPACSKATAARSCSERGEEVSNGRTGGKRLQNHPLQHAHNRPENLASTLRACPHKAPAAPLERCGRGLRAPGRPAEGPGSPAWRRPEVRGPNPGTGIPTPSKSRQTHGAPPKCRASRFQQPLFLHAPRSAVLRGPPAGEGAAWHVLQ